LKTKILNLIDFEKVNTLLEGFNQSTGFVTAILDLDGNVLSKSGWRQVCTEFHRTHPETSKRCTLSDTILAGQLAKGEKYHFYKCMNGLVDVAVPIVIKGEHIANLFSGQFFFEKPDDSFFKEQARKYGFDEASYIKALNNVPVVSEEKVKAAMEFLLNMTQLITEMTFQKLEQIILNEELRTSEERYRLVLENSMDAILLTSPDGTIFSANHAACVIFQRSEEEICSLGRNGIADMSDPRMSVLLEERRRVGKAKGEILMLRKDGTKFPVELSTSVYTDHNGIVRTSMIIRDITERKQAEEALQKSEARYHLLFENMLEGMSYHQVVFDNEKAIDYIYLEVNKAFEVHTGLTNVVGRKVSEIMPGILKNNPELFERFGRVAKTSIPEQYETYVASTNTWFFTSLYHLTDDIVVSFFENITQKKRVELERMESEERFRKAFEEAPMGIAMASLTTGQLFSTNNSLCEMLGYSDEELRQLTFLDVTYPDDCASDVEAVKNIVEGRIHKHVTEKRYIRKDGGIIWGLRALTKINYSGGKPDYALAMIKDITDRKHAEEEIKKLNAELEFKVELRTAQLEASNKELEAFSYSVSHDLRAPLRHINGYVNLLNERYSDELPEKALHYLETVTTAAKQMGMLIDDLLQFSRTGRQEVHQTTTDMNILIKEVLEKIKPDTENRKINWDVQELPEVFGDYSLLKQVWLNLLDNAIKYTRNKKLAEISIGCTVNQENIVFFVRDNGVGFDMKYAHKLFGVFQRLHTQAEFEGTGIGLANVQRIIFKHNGQVWAEAKLDLGATFFFSLPKK